MAMEAANRIICILRKYKNDITRAIQAQKGYPTGIWFRVQNHKHLGIFFQVSPKLETTKNNVRKGFKLAFG
eukprot:8217279-Ditylum_brightwellii.AAC.1